MDTNVSNASDFKKVALLSSLLHSLDQFGEQSGRRQPQRSPYTTGNRFRSRIKRLARTARQRNRGPWKRARNIFRQTYRLSQKRYLRQCRHNFGRTDPKRLGGILQPSDTLYYKSKA